MAIPARAGTRDGWAHLGEVPEGARKIGCPENPWVAGPYFWCV